MSTKTMEDLLQYGDLARPKGLSKSGISAHGAIVDYLHDANLTHTGGSKAFYSPAEWRARGEKYGHGGELVIVYDGGDLVNVFSGPDLPEALSAELGRLGCHVEGGTSWYSTVYCEPKQSSHGRRRPFKNSRGVDRTLDGPECPVCRGWNCTRERPHDAWVLGTPANKLIQEDKAARPGARQFPVVAADGRVIAHVTGSTYVEALQDFRVSQRAGWYDRDSRLDERPSAHARLDADRTARPLSRIVGHAPQAAPGQRQGPHGEIFGAETVRLEYEDEDGRRRPLKNPTARRGGVQSMEDYADFGAIYRHTAHRWPGSGAGKASAFEDGDDLSFSDLHALEKYQHLEPTDLLLPEHTGGSDYNGGSIAKANYESFLELYGDLPGVSRVHGGHGSFGVAVRLDAITEDMVKTLQALADYPLIDEEKLGEIEHEAEDEAWTSYVRRDFMQALTKAYPDQEENIDAMSEEDLAMVFFHFADKSNTYWEHGNEGAYIDVERVAAAVDEDLLSDPARWAGWPG